VDSVEEYVVDRITSRLTTFGNPCFPGQGGNLFVVRQKHSLDDVSLNYETYFCPMSSLIPCSVIDESFLKDIST
jgi:hypothetical protein